MYDIIIIGAGPAGLTSALYALRANKKVLIFEAKNYGGQIINARKIENYPAIKEISGVEFAIALYNQVKDLGAEFKFETVLRIDENKNVITNKNSYKTKAIIIATGADKKKLGIENEERFVGAGVSYCATCDGNFYKGKNVAVVGSGNNALEDTLYLSNLASKVYLIYTNDNINEERLYNKLKQKENIEIFLNSKVKKINGENNLQSIEIIDSENKNSILEIQGLFIDVGQEPKNEIFKNVVKLNEFGYIKSVDGVHTEVNGIYIAGDAREKTLRQLTTAVGDGANAATTAIKEMI